MYNTAISLSPFLAKMSTTFRRLDDNFLYNFFEIVLVMLITFNNSPDRITSNQY